MMTPIFIPSGGGGISTKVLIITIVMGVVLGLYIIQFIIAISDYSFSYEFQSIQNITGKQLMINLIPGKPVYDLVISVKRNW